MNDIRTIEPLSQNLNVINMTKGGFRNKRNSQFRSSDSQTLLCINLQQNVRQVRSYEIKIPFTKTQKCIVASFTLQGAKYEKVMMMNEQKCSFVFQYIQKFVGNYEGKLILEDQSNLYMYKIVVNVKLPIENQINLKTVERKIAIGKIKLQSGEWKIIKGNSNIVSQTNFILPSQNKYYQLEYYSSVREQKQFILTFQSQQFGQFAYLVKVLVEEMPEIKLDYFKAQLGKIHEEEVEVQNEEQGAIKIQSKCSNGDVFFCYPQSFVIAPKSKFKVKIIYRPSSLEIQQGRIIFSDEKYCRWHYNLCGYGLLQQQPITQEVEGILGQENCFSINFINPLNKSIKIHVFLQNVTCEAVFTLLLKSSTIELKYLEQTSVPISIKAKKVQNYQGLLKIVVNQKIFWRYRLQAKTLCFNNQVRIFKVPCRIKKQLPAQFILDHLPEIIGPNLTLSIKPLMPNTTAQINSTINVKNITQEINNTKVTFYLQMLCFRPFETTCQFQISQQDGSKWLQKCLIIFQTPEVDDHITITSEINNAKTCLFRLTNRYKSYSKFKAYFTSDSNIQFSIWPTAGELEPYGRDGTSFQVTFAPTQYRTFWKGKLIIETEESYWSYAVKGCLPQYNPPVGVSSFSRPK